MRIRIVRRMLIGLAVAVVALPSWAQVSSDEWERCRDLDSGVEISAGARAGYCTKLIDSGRVSSGLQPTPTPIAALPMNN